MLAKAVASEVDAEVYNIKLTDIATSAYINTGSNNVQKLFAFIRQKAQNNKKIVVILDELDSLFGKRDEINGSREDTKIVNTFLTEMSGFDTMENVIFIGTTNLLANIDPAVIRSGRLTTKVKVDLPNTDGLKQIYQIHLDKLKKISKKFYNATEKLDIDAIVQRSDKLSGADVEEVVRIVAQTKAMEEINGNYNEEITEKYFFDAIEKVKNPNQTRNIGFV